MRLNSSTAAARFPTGDGAAAGLLPPREELAKDLVDELASLEARQPRLFFVLFLEIENVGGVVLERTGEILLGRADRVAVGRIRADRPVVAAVRCRCPGAPCRQPLAGRSCNDLPEDLGIDLCCVGERLVDEHASRRDRILGNDTQPRPVDLLDER